MLKSVSRKVRELSENEQEGSYENASIFIKMLNAQTYSTTKSVFEKLLKLRDRFLSLNNGKQKMLEYIKLDDEFIKLLSKSIK